jgi:dTDP-4-amino-4,6-dideoxygalactose transaminase
MTETAATGTSALWLAVDLLGCEPCDEVITSPLTFSSDIAPLVRSLVETVAEWVNGQ